MKAPFQGTRIILGALTVLGLGACDSAKWHYTQCAQEADKAVRAVSSTERWRECNGTDQCVEAKKADAYVRQWRREARLAACMQARGFTFNAEQWTKDQLESRDSGASYWTRAQ